MNNLSIALAALAVWLALGVLFMSMCCAASRADREMEEATQAMALPHRGLRQHLFALHVRSLRSMRRLGAARGNFIRSGAARETPAGSPAQPHGGLRSAH
ncbi:hypothetical protein GT347_20650 [Xylophilus rhododendri]|uniref:Uncharacterized protein n=1 Tax=Xylophilus rhododendri TaxID=2697032 RepID=A0A857J883_9BURK|nr:hypothetical protein [Xylophilus rhododendri]QHJ00175.1 hypothetical protein GT347_20650 [Xylophilus rhododendri]